MKKFSVTLTILFSISCILLTTSMSGANRYQLNCDKKLVEYSRLLLIQQLGVTEETGNNDGITVGSYLHDIGLSEGNSWCAALQCSMYIRSCLALRYPLNKIPFKITGLANGVLKSFKKGTKTVYKAFEDDFLVWVAPNGINGHIERIIKIINKDLVWTIGGNVSNAVRIQKRSITKKMGNEEVNGIGGIKKI